LVLTDNIETRF